MKDKLIGSLPTIVLGLLIAIAPRTFAPVCEHAGHGHGHEHMEHMGNMGGGSGMSVTVAEGMMKGHMPCYWTAQVSLGIGLLLVLIGVIAFFVNHQVRIGLNLSAGLFYVLEILVATVLIGMCGNPDMSCNVLAKPTLLVLSVVGILAVGAAIFIDQKASEKVEKVSVKQD